LVDAIHVCYCFEAGLCGLAETLPMFIVVLVFTKLCSKALKSNLGAWGESCDAVGFDAASLVFV
jgi:hypothetical protein